jgi:hypothetical protein
MTVQASDASTERGSFLRDKISYIPHFGSPSTHLGRRMAVRLYWMWRNGCEYSPSFEFGSYAGQLGTGHGVNQSAVHLIGHPAPCKGSLQK